MSEKATPQPSTDEAGLSRIVFQDDDIRPTRQNRGTSTYKKRIRSRSRDSSASGHARSVSGLPIEHRVLSFQISESQAIEAYNPKAKEPPKAGEEDRVFFEELDYHILHEDKACERFNVSRDKGLSQDIAAQRLQRDGKNVLPQPRENNVRKVLGYVFGGFCSVLWIGVIIFFICWRPLGDPEPQAYNLGLGILVLIVILLQASFSCFQDWSTKKTMRSILDLLPSDALLLRDGHWSKVSTTEIVAGDIVKVQIGNKVPADLRLIETSGDVRFDRSMLTGETEDVEGAVSETDSNFLETRNIAAMGTSVTNGQAIGVVVLIGGNTIMGRIAKATSGVKTKPTLIQAEISRFVKIIVGLTVCLASLILLTWVGWLRVKHPSYMNVVAMLNNVMGCVVAFIPEGMPIGVALTLMIVARSMKKVNILPKGLSTVETLGCVNVLCSDKTGTLTQNNMTAMSVGFVDHSMTTEEAQELFQSDKSHKALVELYKAATLCNDATFDPSTIHAPVDQRLVQGNSTDAAVLRFAETMKPGEETLESQPRRFQIPFNSKNKWMMTMHSCDRDDKKEGEFLVLVKGAPDVLLSKCASYWSYEDECTKQLDEAARAQFSDLQNRLSRNAERVILLCQRRYTPSVSSQSNVLGDELMEYGMRDLTIIGVLGILDPPRPETAATVASCRKAGIRFFMVTGDYGLTGAAIARRVGIFTGEADPHTIKTLQEIRNSASNDALVSELSQQSLLLEGPQLNDLSDADWDVICSYEEIVFGRTTPDQKLRIVHQLQKRGNAVAVTGDGVNDAPALRAADVGIAIAGGSDVAMEAADLVLLDRFDSIVDAVRLGRLVFQNLQKVIGYLLPAGSWSEIWPVLMNVFIGVPLPLSSFLMIIICVFTDLFLSLSLIMEKEEFDLLSLPPRNHKKDHLINLKIYTQSYLFIGVMETVCAHSMFFLYFYKKAGIPFRDLVFLFEGYTDGFHGYTADELAHFNVVGQCVYFVTLVILQWGNIMSIRNKRLSILQADPIRKERRNPWLIVSILISLAIAIFVTEVPGIQSLFGTASIPIEFWFLPLPLALGILVMDELRKLIVRTWPKGPLARIAW
jgi:sodium/potassium-transporting ATPase subunit alpha